MNQSIVLVGNMGSGKTSVGHELAKLTGLVQWDTDALVEEKSAKSIPDIFASEGEATFRKMETQALASLLSKSPAIISCGGGIVESPAARALLSSCRHVVYLWADPLVLAERVGTSRTRPKLSGKDAALELALLQEKRESLYETVSTMKIDTTHKSPKEIAMQIVSKVKTI